MSLLSRHKNPFLYSSSDLTCFLICNKKWTSQVSSKFATIFQVHWTRNWQPRSPHHKYRTLKSLQSNTGCLLIMPPHILSFREPSMSLTAQFPLNACSEPCSRRPLCYMTLLQLTLSSKLDMPNGIKALPRPLLDGIYYKALFVFTGYNKGLIDPANQQDFTYHGM